jgi:hypothetical protein
MLCGSSNGCCGFSVRSQPENEAGHQLHLGPRSRPRVGNPVTNRHNWQIGHESVVTFQTKELSNFALNFLIFSLEPIFFVICV